MSSSVTSQLLNIVLLGTCDTKLDELLYLTHQIQSLESCTINLIDIGRVPAESDFITTTHTQLLQSSQEQSIDFLTMNRDQYVDKMVTLGTAYLKSHLTSTTIHGVIAIGGSSGTSLAASIMRQALPIGLPKILVSTMASGDISHYIGETDIVMMPSVVDIAGTNSILNGILHNAAGAITGMAKAFLLSNTSEPQSSISTKPRIGITMFGVTTPAVDSIRQYLHRTGSFEIYVFHATGSGGRAMERLVREGKLDALIDLTTTEICDELFGGVLSAGPDRLLAAAEKGIPQVVSVGACDMVNFGPWDTVPGKWEGKGRNFVRHNPAVTLMRTSKEECAEIGAFIARRLKACKDPERVKVVLPVEGISMIAGAGGPFYDPEADEALFGAVKDGLKGSGVEVLSEAMEINDERFAVVVAEAMLNLLAKEG